MLLTATQVTYDYCKYKLFLFGCNKEAGQCASCCQQVHEDLQDRQRLHSYLSLLFQTCDTRGTDNIESVSESLIRAVRCIDRKYRKRLPLSKSSPRATPSSINSFKRCQVVFLVGLQHGLER